VSPAPDPRAEVPHDPRIPLVERDQAALTIRGLYPAEREASNLTKLLANAPDSLAVLAPFLSQVMNASTIDEATKEIVVLRVSALNCCAYCVPTHVVAAARSGLAPEQVRLLADAAPPDGGFVARERAVVALCDRLVADASSVDDALMSELREYFADHEIVELTLLAGAITMLNYVASAFRIPLDPRTLAALP